MKWKVWPRQYGKTHQLRQWWLEDPESRVILCGSENLAQVSRNSLEADLLERRPENTPADNRRLLKTRVLSYKTWLNGTHGKLPRNAVAVDDIEYILPQLFNANVVYGAASGTSDTPDPERKAMVDAFHERVCKEYGLDCGYGD